jgi:ATP-binding cassette subfamily B protein RaxB
MIAAAHGLEMDIGAFRRRFSVSMKGMTLESIIGLASELKLDTTAVRLELEDLRDLRTPAILHWNLNHFVVLAGVKGSRFVIHDPAVGRRVLTPSEVSRAFTGVALEIEPAEGFQRLKAVRRLATGELTGRVRGLRGALAGTITLALVQQIYVLAMPVLLQFAVDRLISGSDVMLVMGVVMALALAALLSAVSERLRAGILTRMGAVMSHRMADGIVKHLLQLPLSWFEQRHTGDIISKLGAAEPIKRLLTQGAISTLVDGGMAMITVMVILLYSPAAAAVVAVAALTGGAIRLWWRPGLMERQLVAVTNEASEQTYLIETVQAAQTIKVGAAETMRHEGWRRLNRRTVAARARMELTQANQALMTNLVDGLETIAIVAMVLSMASSGRITLGALFAILAARRIFSDSARRLLDLALQWQLLEIPKERVADIVHAEPEPFLQGSAQRYVVEAGHIEAFDLSFSYSDVEAPVFENLNLTVAAGEFVALAGPSGCGKTTLLKVLLGLLPPASGEIRIDGRSVRPTDFAHFRRQFGVVMQDDRLLNGTIAENVAFFADDWDAEQIRACCRAAAIDAEIEAMPMGYDTLVGDLGAALSGGQRQRLLLARALYRKPAILFMDEGTSHLDVEAEARINLHLATMKITRVIIAHRPDTLRTADRIIWLGPTGREGAQGAGAWKLET